MSVAIIPDFVKYQIEWLRSHNDLEFEPVIEDAIIQMLKDTGKSFIDEQPDETSQFDHIAESDRKVSVSCGQENDLISRKAAIDCVNHMRFGMEKLAFDVVTAALLELPSAQPERDIPVKPNETTDRAFGIPHRQAVCPKCDYYLGHVVFLGDGKGKKVTYCETCGQAIDWEGWDFDE